jgi:pyruvate-formate lyase-activating enzyme
VPLKKPSELFEQRRKQSLEEELAQKKNQEDEKIKNKKIVSPKELFGETLEEEVLVEEIVEEPVDPYLEEIEALKSDLEKISYAIPEETDLTEVYQNIENLKNRIDNLPKQKSYDEDIQSIREELERIEGSIPVPEVFDPSDLYENISALKNKLEEVRSEIPTIPEPILYDHQLDQLKEMVVDVRNSIPVVPEIRYYEDELNEIINAIEGVRSEIPELPELPELPEIKYYDDEISTIESRLVEIQESIPTVKYYDDELDILDQKIANVKESIPVVPEIKYYDKDVKELKEQIASVKKSIPEVKYYDKDVKELKEKIDSVKNSIPVVPEVKYYDEDIQSLNEEVQDLYKKVSSIKIPDQDKYIREVKGLYSSFEEKNHRLLEKINYLEEVFEKFNEETLTEGLLNEPPEVKNSDPLTPLDQNFVTLPQLQEHYRLFINRIQQQLSIIGGGGETRLEYLDDVDRNSAKVNGRFLKYDAASGKWIGALGGGGGSQTLDDTLGLGNTSSLGMSVGIVTATKYYGDGSSLTGISAGGITSTSSINTTGIITANSYYVGSMQVINSAGQWVGSGLSVYSNIDGGVPNSVYGGIPVIDGGVP